MTEVTEVTDGEQDESALIWRIIIKAFTAWYIAMTIGTCIVGFFIMMFVFGWSLLGSLIGAFVVPAALIGLSFVLPDEWID